MQDWPEDVRTAYESFMTERGWPEDVQLAFVQTVESYRQLELRNPDKHYFECMDEGIRWQFEAVELQGQFLPVRQIQTLPDGNVLCYSWKHLEDAEGGLAESTLDTSHEGLRRISAEIFYDSWREPDPGA
jgi:hypothetical protein